MTESFEKLLILQDRDRRILQFAREMRDIPQRKQDIDDRLQRHRDALALAEQELQTGTLKLKELEGDVETFSLRMRKYKEQQMAVKNNDEYRALEREIINTRRDVTKFEERQLIVMEQMEGLKATVIERKAELAEQEGNVQHDLDAMDERIADIEKEIAGLKSNRDDFKEGIDPQWLSRYERILNNKGDVAIVSIDNGTCGGCHMTLPPQVVHDARKGTALVSCSFCGRLVYLVG